MDAQVCRNDDIPPRTHANRLPVMRLPSLNIITLGEKVIISIKHMLHDHVVSYIVLVAVIEPVVKIPKTSRESAKSQDVIYPFVPHPWAAVLPHR